MTTTESSKTLTLGAMVEKLVARADAIAGEGAPAADLAAHSLERVLARGGNLRLAAALAGLARELAPGSSTARRRFETPSLVLARAA
ncbi:MAG TPA: hypothetical protein VHO06_01750 [Polyangia bacterium]|nr:hypothetical protein [Polyangia bacterium]